LRSNLEGKNQTTTPEKQRSFTETARPVAKKSFDVADRAMLRSLDFFGPFFIKKKRNDPSAVKSRGEPKAKASP